MGLPILIEGSSGSGKSASMRNFEPGEIGIFNVASKPLPFRKKLSKLDNATYSDIYERLQAPKLKSYVIDDSQYLMCFEMFNRVKEIGYTKFTETAMNFYNLVQFVIRGLPRDVIVYFLHHSETTEDGHVKAKTSGKMLDNQLTLEGLFAIVLLAKTENGKYTFVTQSDGMTTAKSPMELFDREIDNDLKFVDNAVREYYEMSDVKTVQEHFEKIKTIQKEVSDDIKT
ncbi:MAG: hypothetical protein WC547_01180 [Candidatus Omnitrophota bacterium]